MSDILLNPFIKTHLKWDFRFTAIYSFCQTKFICISMNSNHLHSCGYSTFASLLIFYNLHSVSSDLWHGQSKAIQSTALYNQIIPWGRVTMLSAPLERHQSSLWPIYNSWLMFPAWGMLPQGRLFLNHASYGQSNGTGIWQRHDTPLIMVWVTKKLRNCHKAKDHPYFVNSAAQNQDKGKNKTKTGSYSKADVSLIIERPVQKW